MERCVYLATLLPLAQVAAYYGRHEKNAFALLRVEFLKGNLTLCRNGGLDLNKDFFSAQERLFINGGYKPLFMEHLRAALWIGMDASRRTTALRTALGSNIVSFPTFLRAPPRTARPA